MSEIRFRVIDGGLAHCPSPTYREIHSCWVTDTRLMGVLVLCVRWKNTDSQGCDLFQYFYFDYEEYGLDRYESYAGENRMELAELETDLIGGLGGRKVALRMEEAIWLIQKFLAHNQNRHIEMPGNYGDYSFYLGMKASLNQKEEQALWQKCCVSLRSENALANYFMMRCFGRDFSGASLLTVEGVETDLFPEFSAGTLFRNQVLLSVERNGCQCRSLIEAGGNHFLVVTELDFYNMKISGYRRTSVLPLSPPEVYMNLSHEEYITVYRYEGDVEEFGRHSLRSVRQAVINREHGGRTFLIYQPDNSHVEKSTYRLHEDLMGVIHVSEGQMLVSASNLRNIHRLEIDLHTSMLMERLALVGSFEFLEPVLMRYLESRFDDFMDFLETIKLE